MRSISSNPKHHIAYNHDNLCRISVMLKDLGGDTTWASTQASMFLLLRTRNKHQKKIPPLTINFPPFDNLAKSSLLNILMFWIDCGDIIILCQCFHHVILSQLVNFYKRMRLFRTCPRSLKLISAPLTFQVLKLNIKANAFSFFV